MHISTHTYTSNRHRPTCTTQMWYKHVKILCVYLSASKRPREILSSEIMRVLYAGSRGTNEHFLAVLRQHTWQIFLSVTSVTTSGSLGAHTCVRNCSRSPACKPARQQLHVRYHIIQTQ